MGGRGESNIKFILKIRWKMKHCNINNVREGNDGGEEEEMLDKIQRQNLRRHKGENLRRHKGFDGGRKFKGPIKGSEWNNRKIASEFIVKPPCIYIS